MVKIRLKRIGARKRPFYRIVVANSTAARNGKFIEIIGTYDPCSTTQAPMVIINEEKARKWLQNGAQPSDTVRALLSKQGISNSKEVLPSTA